MNALYCYLNEHHPNYLQLKTDFQTKKLAALVKTELVILPFVLLTFFFNFLPIKENNNQVLGAVIETAPIVSPSPTPTASPTPTVLPTPTSTPVPTVEPTKPPFPSPRKNSYSIAILGDSMVDTMGERLEYLEHSLKRKYPNVNFTLYNFGKGSENVEMGLARLNSRLDYQDRHYPPLPEIRPDILIIGSFAYNPFSPYDRDRHWLGLTKLLEAARTVSSHIYFLAEIAPLRKDFGKGPNGVNWDEPTSYEHSGWIIQQLENTVGLSRTLNVPLINAYQQSGGARSYVNPSDGIHPSVAGHEFTADLITETIKLD